MIIFFFLVPKIFIFIKVSISYLLRFNILKFYLFNIILLLKFEIKNKNSFHVFIQKEDLHIHTSCIRGTETTLSNLLFQCLSSTK